MLSLQVELVGQSVDNEHAIGTEIDCKVIGFVVKVMPII